MGPLNRPITSLGRSAEPVPNRRSTDREPHRGWRPILAIAIGIAALDWSTKAIIAATIPVNEMVVVVENRLAFWHVRNPAMILGLFGDLPMPYRRVMAWMLAIVGLTLLHEVVTRAHRLLPHRRPWAWLFVGLVLGGMIGNIGERLRHWGVTDFLSFGWRNIWLPPGNIADLAIFLSVPIAPLVIAFEIEARARRSRPPAAESPADAWPGSERRQAPESGQQADSGQAAPTGRPAFRRSGSTSASEP